MKSRSEVPAMINALPTLPPEKPPVKESRGSAEKPAPSEFDLAVRKFVRHLPDTIQVQLAALCAAEPGKSRAEHLRSVLEAGLGALAPHVDLSAPPPGFPVAAWVELSTAERRHVADLMEARRKNEGVIASIVRARAEQAVATVIGSVEHVLHLSATRDDAAICRAMAVDELATYARRG